MHAGTAYIIVLTHIFFHPDYTVGPGVSPGQRAFRPGRGLYRQWGIAPRPEDISFSCPLL